jgi:hypothetical protein
LKIVHEVSAQQVDRRLREQATIAEIWAVSRFFRTF